MRMLWILPPKIRKELSCLELQILWQRGGLKISFLQFDFSALVFVEFEDEIGEPFKIGIHRAIQGNFRVAQGKPALDWVVIAQLQTSRRVACRRPANIHQGSKTDVHVG